jgi:hypothetical protein
MEEERKPAAAARAAAEDPKIAAFLLPQLGAYRGSRFRTLGPHPIDRFHPAFFFFAENLSSFNPTTREQAVVRRHGLFKTTC